MTTKTDEKYDIAVRDTLTGILTTAQNMQVVKPEDHKFLVEHKEHLNKVFAYTYMWRTDMQKRSIVSDNYHPTLHSKFHQAILEQKVQLDQAFYLAKDFEMKKLDIEELMCDLEELGDTKRDEIKKKKLQIEIQFKQYELSQLQTAMYYRMSEVKGWQKIEEDLLDLMRQRGIDEESIWSKDAGEIEDMFFSFLTNLYGLKHSTDGGEANNLVALAKFAVQQAKEAGIFEKLVARCNQFQLEALKMLQSL